MHCAALANPVTNENQLETKGTIILNACKYANAGI